MIKKLRRKFIIIIMSILFVVFALILVTLNLITYRSGEIQSKNIMNQLAQNEGRLPMMNRPGKFFQHNNTYSSKFNNSIIVKLDSNNAIIGIKSIGSSDEADKNLNSLIKSALKKKAEFGIISSFRYIKKAKDYGIIIVFTDNSIEDNLNQRLLFLSLIIGALSMIVFFFVSLFLSRLIVKPVEDSFNKQKQFISDASHELKTPLSVISVNAEVLENEVGSSKWLGYIKSETARMSGLVNQLLDIAHMDDAQHQLNITNFNLSEAVYLILLPFESTTFEQQKTYTYNIEESVMYSGEQDSIKQMAAILIDNAIKNTEKNGAIHVSLKQQSSRIYFEVYNTGKGIDPSEQDKIFERFYCSDYSRSRENGGYGLGLSIAKSIVEAHHGKINVQSKLNEWAKFTVVL